VGSQLKGGNVKPVTARAKKGGSTRGGGAEDDSLADSCGASAGAHLQEISSDEDEPPVPPAEQHANPSSTPCTSEPPDAKASATSASSATASAVPAASTDGAAANGAASLQHQPSTDDQPTLGIDAAVAMTVGATGPAQGEEGLEDWESSILNLESLR